MTNEVKETVETKKVRVRKPETEIALRVKSVLGFVRPEVLAKATHARVLAISSTAYTNDAAGIEQVGEDIAKVVSLIKNLPEGAELALPSTYELVAKCTFKAVADLDAIMGSAAEALVAKFSFYEPETVKRVRRTSPSWISRLVKGELVRVKNAFGQGEPCVCKMVKATDAELEAFMATAGAEIAEGEAESEAENLDLN